MNWLVTVLGVLSFLVLIPLAIISGTSGFIPELLIFAALTVLLAYYANALKLKVPVLTLVILGMLLHGFGVLGFYGVSPLPIQWDHVTHFVGLFAFALLIFGFVEQWMDARVFSKKNVFLFILIFLAAQGVGAVIELSEFAGYLKWGFGEGAFAFGPGDGLPSAAHTDAIDNIGGGWINTGWDLIFNSLGILAAMLILVVRRALVARPKSAYYFEDVGEWSRRVN